MISERTYILVVAIDVYESAHKELGDLVGPDVSGVVRICGVLNDVIDGFFNNFLDEVLVESVVGHEQGVVYGGVVGNGLV